MKYLSLLILLPLVATSQSIPKWEDFHVATIWKGPNAPVKLMRKDERMFRTRLTEAAKKLPDFAGHYRIAGIGCGSACGAAAIVDLQTGRIYQPPGVSEKQIGWDRWIFGGGFTEGEWFETRADSRLGIVRQDRGDKQEVLYYEWTGTKFKLLTQRTEKKSFAR